MIRVVQDKKGTDRRKVQRSERAWHKGKPVPQQKKAGARAKQAGV